MKRGFTLIELLMVVAIVAILSAIAVVNFREASRRAMSAQCKSRLHTIVTGMQMYRIDWNRLPFSDGSQGPLQAGEAFRPTTFGNGPASGGFWNGVPLVLVSGNSPYVGGGEVTLGCPSLQRLHPDRIDAWRYAYNVGGYDSLQFDGGADPEQPIDGAGVSGAKVWMCRCLFVNSSTWAPQIFPGFPHGEEFNPAEGVWGEENVLWNSGSVTQEPGMEAM